MRELGNVTLRRQFIQLDWVPLVQKTNAVELSINRSIKFDWVRISDMCCVDL